MIALNNLPPRRLRLGLCAVLVGTLVGFAASGSAQQSTEPDEALEAPVERWFKVELMIFSQPPKGGATSENWDPNPVLEYPGESRFLIQPDVIAANLASYDATGVVDEFGRQILTLNLPPLEEEVELLELDEDGNPVLPDVAELDEPDETSVGDTDEELLALENELDTAALDTATQDELETGLVDVPVEEEEEAEPLPLKPTPFVALDDGALRFSGKTIYMQRRGGYQILFHASWAQPVLAEEAALPLIIDRSGDALQWPLLQGSVKLYLSRFLHLETNLWLNTMADYFAQDWQIPPAPLGPQSLIIEYPLVLPGDFPPVEGQNLASEDTQQTDPALVTDTLTPEKVFSMTQQQWEQADAWNFDEPMATDPVYPWRHAVVLRQKRKMRSTEVHYIDHPMLGVVALITPLDEEELDAMARVEILAEEAAAAKSAEGLPGQDIQDR